MAFEVHILASGSDGNCYVVVNDDRAVMVDCGVCCKTAKELMNLSGIDHSIIEGILVTHEHSDHTKGVRVTKKFIEKDRKDSGKCPVYCTHGTYANSNELKEVGEYTRVQRMKTFKLAGMDITPLPTSHDVKESCCYHFSNGEKNLLIVTDTGILPDQTKEALKGCDAAVIESNYDPEMLRNNRIYPDYLKARIASDFGHMSNQYCGMMIKDTITDKKRRFFLAHLSKHNNTPDLARETVSKVSGIRRSQLDCLETPKVPNDTRIFRV